MSKFINPWKPEGKFYNNDIVADNANNTSNQTYSENKTNGIRTVRNVSKKSIWCKNESNSRVFEVLSGASTNKRIDGLTHWNKPGEVFKVADRIDKIFGITVYDEGIAFDTVFWPLDREFNLLLGGGWLTEPPDDGWNLIFEKSDQ